TTTTDAPARREPRPPWSHHDHARPRSPRAPPSVVTPRPPTASLAASPALRGHTTTTHGAARREPRPPWSHHDHRRPRSPRAPPSVVTPRPPTASLAASPALRGHTTTTHGPARREPRPPWSHHDHRRPRSPRAPPSVVTPRPRTPPLAASPALRGHATTTDGLARREPRPPWSHHDHRRPRSPRAPPSVVTPRPRTPPLAASPALRGHATTTDGLARREPRPPWSHHDHARGRSPRAPPSVVTPRPPTPPLAASPALRRHATTTDGLARREPRPPWSHHDHARARSPRAPPSVVTPRPPTPPLAASPALRGHTTTTHAPARREPRPPWSRHDHRRPRSPRAPPSVVTPRPRTGPLAASPALRGHTTTTDAPARREPRPPSSRHDHRRPRSPRAPPSVVTPRPRTGPLAASPALRGHTTTTDAPARREPRPPWSHHDHRRPR